MAESRALTEWVALTGATERRDWDAAMACLAPECEWTLVPTGLHLKVTEAIRSFMQARPRSSPRSEPMQLASSSTSAVVLPPQTQLSSAGLSPRNWRTRLVSPPATDTNFTSASSSA